MKFLFTFLALIGIAPLIVFANGGDQRVVDNTYLINLSRAPFTPRVGVKTSMLASFVDIQKNKLVADDIIVSVRITKLGGSGSDKKMLFFEEKNKTVKGGILELSYTFGDTGLHEIFFDFALASNPQKIYNAPDFLIDVQQAHEAISPIRDILFFIAGGMIGAIVMGIVMRFKIKIS